MVDHIIPVARGGSNDIDNLVAACESCNQGKSALEIANRPGAVLADEIATTKMQFSLMAALCRVLQLLRETPQDQADLALALDWADHVLTSTAYEFTSGGRPYIEELAKHCIPEGW